MKKIKLIFFALIFIPFLAFANFKSRDFKTAIKIGMKENPEINFKQNFSSSAKEKDFKFSIREKVKLKGEKKLEICIKENTGSISGYVYDIEGNPVEGIEVYLFLLSYFDPESEYKFHPLSFNYSMTNSDGFYNIHFEEEGSYILYAVDPENYFLPQYYDHKESYKEADILFLKPGEELNGLNFHLKKSATISGKVLDLITGEGIWGIYVYTINQNFDFKYGIPYFIYSVTDDNGNFKLSGLFPGTYQIYAIDFGNFYGEGIYPEEILITGSEDITGINFYLNPTDTGIKGKIFMPEGEPVSNGWVYAIDFIDPWNFSKFYFSYSNSKGEYRLGMEEGNYLIQGGTFDQKTLPTYYPGVRNISDAESIEIKKGEVKENINFKLLPAGFIEGNVLSNDGFPISGINIVAFDLTGFEINYGATDGDGKFLIGALDSGTYYLYAFDWNGNYAPQWYNGKKSFLEADPVNVVAGEKTSGINFSLKPSGKIKGKVLDFKTLVPLKDIMLIAYSENLYYESYGFSDEEGNFEIKGLADGSYIIFGYDFNNEYIQTYYDEVIDPSLATPVEVQEGKEIYIKFKMIKGGKINGFVRNKENFPVSYSFVIAFDSNGSWAGFGYGDEEGKYSIGGLLDGSYLLYAMDPNGEYAPKWYDGADSPESATPVFISPGEVKENINFYLPKAGSISGKVTDENENPMPYMYLFAKKINQNENFLIDLQWGWTDEEGNYKINGLGNGIYIVGLLLSNGMIYYYNGTFNYEEATPVQVIEGEETKNINFVINYAKGRISGKVLDSQTENPIPFAFITVYDESGIPISFTATDRDGKYTAGFIKQGKYKVFSLALGYKEEWYKEKSSFEEADLVYVPDKGYVKEINFTLEPLNHKNF